MTSKQIITHCAPTLAGLKTANLFNEHYDDKFALVNEIKGFNELFKDKGVKMIPLTMENNRALIYVFRKDSLLNDFNNDLSKSILEKYGYDATDVNKSLKKLSGKVTKKSDFPHEIGLFLGYPPEDVLGFIENGGKNCKFVGYWKAYNNVDKAIESFRKYRKCQKIYLDRLNKGYSLKQLVI